jgi:RNA polymerase sigma-70 factor (ECF subfamily)
MDADLVIQAQHGDRAAFGELVALVGRRFQSTADGILRDRSVAEDATQQALIRLWRDLPTLRHPERFEAWATRILVRACYDEARRARRWGRISVSGPQPIEADREPVTRGPDAFDAIADRDQLDRAFRRLSVEQRAVVVLHHYLNLTRPEIAATLGVPLGTVNSRLHHALAAMRAGIDADLRVASARTLEKVV